MLASPQSSKRGFGLNQYAEAMHSIMTTLGYREYVLQGDDWGSLIARTIARKLSITHQSNPHQLLPPTSSSPLGNSIILYKDILLVPFSSGKKVYFSSVFHYLNKGTGYFTQQATRRQTIGYALHDSPVALLTWIYDKLHLWMDEYPWTDDEILTLVSIYLFSAAEPAASTRIYYETSEDGSLVESVRKTVPGSVRIGVAQFKGG